MTSEHDRRVASEIRHRWHQLSHSFDRNIARSDVRGVLSAASWRDDNFQLQLVGLNHCLREASSLNFNVDYGWVLCREAYDFTTEPVYQYALLSALLGLWRDVEPPSRTSTVFEKIVVRQTHGWAVSGRRTEPLALNHPEPRIGWIQIPFAWDDLLQLALGGWLDSLEVDRQASLTAFCNKVAGIDVRAVDWSAAHPYWNGLLGRAIVGRLRAPHEEEADIAERVCTSIAGLSPFIAHQSGVVGQDLGNTLAYLAKAFTVAHEASHIVRRREGQVFPQRLEDEQDADTMAMGALWNDGLCIASEVREGQNFEMLWAASGLVFFFGLLVFGNLTRSVADESTDRAEVPSLQAEPTQHEMTVARLRSWSALAQRLAENKSAAGEGALLEAWSMVQSLLPSIVAYCNALLDYGKVVGRPALREALTRFTPSTEIGVRKMNSKGDS